MIQPTTGAQFLDAANPLTLNGGRSMGSTNFAEQLATAIKGAIEKSGNGSQFEIDLETGPGVSSASGNFTIRVTEMPSTSAAEASAANTVFAPAAQAAAQAENSSSYVPTYGYTPAQELAVATGEITNGDGSVSPGPAGTTTWALQQVNDATAAYIAAGHPTPSQFSAAFDIAMGYPIPAGTPPYNPDVTSAPA